MTTISYNAFRIIHIMFLKMEIKSYFSVLLHAGALRVGRWGTFMRSCSIKETMWECYYFCFEEERPAIMDILEESSAFSMA
jgi:hypothetical protein